MQEYFKCYMVGGSAAAQKVPAIKQSLDMQIKSTINY